MSNKLAQLGGSDERASLERRTFGHQSRGRLIEVPGRVEMWKFKSFLLLFSFYHSSFLLFKCLFFFPFSALEVDI